MKKKKEKSATSTDKTIDARRGNSVEAIRQVKRWPHFMKSIIRRILFRRRESAHYKPIDPFWYGDSVNIKINASDLAVDSVNVMETVEYSFHILNDTEPPEIVWKSPGLPRSHIPLEAEFNIDLIDALAGVNIESFVFKFQGEVKHPVISGNRRTCWA
nr:hypothetical protein [Desulfobacterales bacterium]